MCEIQLHIQTLACIHCRANGAEHANILSKSSPNGSKSCTPQATQTAANELPETGSSNSVQIAWRIDLKSEVYFYVENTRNQSKDLPD